MARKRDRPPPYDPYRQTPRMLSRLLRHLRTSGHVVSEEAMAERLGFKKSTIRKWEFPDDPRAAITYAYLERYQDWYGIPVGVLLVISHMAAAVRDNREKDLKKIAEMLKLLADRALGDHPIPLMKVSDQCASSKVSYEGWDEILEALVDTIHNAIPRNDRVLKNHKRLEYYRNQSRGGQTADGKTYSGKSQKK